jgi:hypothetical protein
LVDDFERGPGVPEAKPNPCTLPQFSGFNPSVSPSIDGGSLQCDFPGWNTSSCKDELFCDSGGGVCPAYIGRDQCAWRGDHSVRLFYNIDNDGGAFSGIVLNISNAQDSSSCQVSQVPLDVTNFGYLSLRVRPGDARGNAEVALQDVHSTATNLVETNPKMVLVSSLPGGDNLYSPGLTAEGMLTQGQWTEVQIPVCDLLRRKMDDGGLASLDHHAITKVFIDFAKNRFIAEGTDLPRTRYMDIDDVMFLPCRITGCPTCLPPPP